MTFLKFGFGYFIEEDEKVLRVFRHPFIFVLPRMFIHVLLWGGLTYVFYFLYPTYDFKSSSGVIHSYDLTMVWGFFALLTLYKVLGALGYWYYNGIVMTNESLIFVDWKKFFHRNFSRIDFHNLDEIEVEKRGIRSFLLNYGDLRFEKVNGGSKVLVHRINRPMWTSRTIERYREKILDAKNFTEESALKNLLSQMVQHHVDEHGQPTRETERFRLKTKDFYHLEEAEQEVVEARKQKEASFFEKLVPKKIVKKEQRYREIEVEKELDDTGGFDLDLDR